MDFGLWTIMQEAVLYLQPPLVPFWILDVGFSMINVSVLRFAALAGAVLECGFFAPT